MPDPVAFTEEVAAPEGKTGLRGVHAPEDTGPRSGSSPRQTAEAVREGDGLEEPEVTRRLRAQYAEISQLAGGLAHEIRNPLSTLSLNLDLLAEDFEVEETPRDRRARQRVERLKREV